jgi:hypothetical protein
VLVVTVKDLRTRLSFAVCVLCASKPKTPAGRGLLSLCELPCPPNLYSWLLFSVLVAAVPIALYHAVETPMIRFGNRLSNAAATTL